MNLQLGVGLKGYGSHKPVGNVLEAPYFRGADKAAPSATQNVLKVTPGVETGQNGYSAFATQTDTCVIVPQGTRPNGVIYVNGDRVFGHGVDTYEEHRRVFPSAPSVEGPGWKDSGFKQKI
jgi:hypothetical protein